MKSYLLAKFMHLLILIFIALTVVTLVTLPFLVDKYTEMTGAQASNPLELKVFLYLTAIPFLILLVMGRKLCKNILENIPFCQSSITSLQVISICAFADFLLYASGTILILKNLLSLTLMVAAFMVGLVSLILSQLIQLASEIKEENDLTI